MYLNLLEKKLHAILVALEELTPAVYVFGVLPAYTYNNVILVGITRISTFIVHINII